MTKAYRSADEQELLSFRTLERRVANLERAGAGLVAIMQKASAQLVLGAAFADVSGTVVTISKPGRYFAVGNADISISVASAGNVIHVSLGSTGSASASVVPGFHPTDVAGQFGTRMTFGTFTFTGAGTISLQGKRTAGTATFESANSATGILVVRTGAA